MRRLLLLLVAAWAVPLWAQFSYPASASDGMVFTQLADGGPPTQKWTTTVNFTNPNLVTAASVTVKFFDDNGQPLALDFGQGASPILNLTVPAGGSKSMTSSGASATTVVGWAKAKSDSPVTGMVLYSATQNGAPQYDVAAVATGPTFYYNSFANANLGIAVVNSNQQQPIHLKLTARDQSGIALPAYLFSLNPFGHTAFNLFPTVPGVTTAFAGSIMIEPTDDPPLPFAAWSVNAHNGLLSPLPPGEMYSPGPPDQGATKVSTLMGQAVIGLPKDAATYLLGADPGVIAGIVMGMNLVADPDVTMKASFNTADNSIHLSQGLIEALGADQASLGFIIAHMGAHGVFAHTGPPTTGPFANDVEGAADAAAEFALLQAGYDPDGAADFYSRLLYGRTQTLGVDSSLQAEFALPNGIPGRLQKLWTNVQNACVASAGLTAICQKARKYWHPDNPANVP